MKKLYPAIGIFILGFINYGCHSRKDQQAPEIVAQDSTGIEEKGADSQLIDPVTDDSATMNVADSVSIDSIDSEVKANARPKSTKSKPAKNKTANKRKESGKKGFTSIRAERRKHKSK